MQYLKAKKKFREYKKKFQDDLEIWKNLQNSPRAESDQQQKIDTESAIPLEAEPQTNSQIRSSTSAGQLQSDQLSSKTENKKDRSRSASSLPQIHKSNTITEKEKLPLVKEQRRERKKEVIGKEIKGKIIQESSRSFLTALDDVLIAEGEEGEEGEDGNKAEPHPEEVPKPIKKKEKPEWVTETDRDRPKRKEATLDEKKVALKKNEKLAKLVRSAEDCYSQDVEPSVPKKVKTQVKIDTSYTKRRRNRLDPRNNIKKPRKKPVAAAGKKKKMRKKVSSKEAEEAMKMIEETATHAETLELAPQRAVEILEKHQRPNLIVTKRLQIGRRPQKVDAERRNVVEEVEKIVPESRKISSKETSPKDENGNYEDPKGEDGSYEDDAFESDEGDATCTLPPKSFSDGDGDGDVNGDADEDDEYKDDDEFEEDHEQSPVRIALNASAKFNISVLLEENDPNDDPIPANGSRPSTRRERGGSRSGDPTGGISGIELLSSGQRIGSASNSRRSSRKLPPYENTEPLIIASESEPRPPSRNIHSSHDRKSLVKETNPPAVTTTTTTQLHVVSSPTPQLPTISPSTQSSPSIPAITGIKQHYHHTSTVDDSKKQTSLHLPTNFNLVGDSHRSPALQPSATSSPSEVNVDSKSHQHYMRSDRKTVMRLTPNANLVASDMVGSPTLLDMNIMKQSGQVRRAIKREDSFDKLTRKIARSLANSQTSL